MKDHFVDYILQGKSSRKSLLVIQKWKRRLHRGSVQCNVTSATGMTKISMKNSKCAMSKQKKKDGRPSRYKKHERKKKARGERAKKRARVEKLQKKMKNCQKMKKDQQKDYRNVVSSPWETNNICTILPGAKYG